VSLDLPSIRLELKAMRSRHSHNPAIAKPINLLLSEISHLRQTGNGAHARKVGTLIQKTLDHLAELTKPKT
jgi:hypothetical protein